MWICHLSASLLPSWGRRSAKRCSNFFRRNSLRWQMWLNWEITVWPFPCVSLLCPSRVWTASCGLLWTWNWTCRCPGRARPGWTRSCTCCGSSRPSWRRPGSRARGSSRRGSARTSASASSSSRPRSRWVGLPPPARGGVGRRKRLVTFPRLLLRPMRSSCRRNGWRRCWGRRRRTSTRSGARAAKRSPRCRPSGESTVPGPQTSTPVPSPRQPTHLLLLCFQREDGLLHTGKEQHPEPAGWRRVEKHFKAPPPRDLWPRLPLRWWSTQLVTWWRSLNPFNTFSREKRKHFKWWRNKVKELSVSNVRSWCLSVSDSTARACFCSFSLLRSLFSATNRLFIGS